MHTKDIPLRTPRLRLRRVSADVAQDPRTRYEAQIADAIGWVGQEHDVFLRIKAEHMMSVSRSRIGSLSDCCLLDVGCGIGLMHKHFLTQFGSVAGTDLSVAAVDAARLENPGVRYESFDGDRLPFESASFDAVSATNVLHHVPPGARTALLREMSRIVRPGGVCLIAEHNPLNPVTRFIVARCEFDHDAVLLWPRESRRLLAGAGFDGAVGVRYVVSVPSAAPWAVRLDNRLGRFPFGAQYVAIGTRTSS